MKKTVITLSICASVTLHAQQNQATIEPITITTASKSKQSIKDVTSDVAVISAMELEEKNIKTLSEALNLVSGISVTSNGGLGSTTSVNLRGNDNKRVLVLIDGMRYQDPSNSSGSIIAHLTLQDIEQIEVIKGAQSGIWGAEASAGVINIITKKAQKGTNANAHLEYGSFDTKRYGINITHAQE
ncbi:MAG: TonB-dependent receptor, partial [Campylobacterota bacterium]